MSSVQFANGIIHRNENALKSNTNRTITKTDTGFEVEFSRVLGNGKEISGQTTVTNNDDGSVTVTGNRVRPNSTVEFDATFTPKGKPGETA